MAEGDFGRFGMCAVSKMRRALNMGGAISVMVELAGELRRRRRSRMWGLDRVNVRLPLILHVPLIPQLPPHHHHHHHPSGTVIPKSMTIALSAKHSESLITSSSPAPRLLESSLSSPPPLTSNSSATHTHRLVVAFAVLCDKTAGAYCRDISRCSPASVWPPLV